LSILKANRSNADCSLLHSFLMPPDPISHDSLAAMVSAYAQQAVELSGEFNAELDFSENSLLELETILDRLARDMETGKPSTEDLAEACKIWGSYFGEVVRRRFGGEWSVETYPGKEFATLTLTVQGSKLFPTMKIHRRLTEGDNENLWAFFKMVKSRLEAAPKIQ
jgi:hypothetical protein